MRKVGTAFHETMKFRRINITEALRQFALGVTSVEEIHLNTALGTNEAKTAPAYLRACGLADNERNLTPFGSLVLGADPSAGSLSTLWLIHYHLSAPHLAGPTFWSRLVTRYFSSGAITLDSNKLIEDLIQHILDVENKAISPDTARSTVNVFLKAYSEYDGLGGLGILDEAGMQTYLVGTPVEIPWRVMAYILADFWEANWQQLSVPYAQINGDNGPAPLMLVNSGQMSQLMKPMQEAGLLEVSKVTRPWTVLRKWNSKDELLEAVYTDGF